MQPIVRDDKGVIRFRENAIVRHILDVASEHGANLNDIACRPFSTEDREQLAQLIGYSIGGYAELPYVRDETYARAEAAVNAFEKKEYQATTPREVAITDP
jgi:hypothetical protein